MTDSKLKKVTAEVKEENEGRYSVDRSGYKIEKVEGESCNSYCRFLILTGVFDDKEITEMVQERFPEGRFLKKYVNCKRWDLNHEAELAERIAEAKERIEEETGECPDDAEVLEEVLAEYSE